MTQTPEDIIKHVPDTLIRILLKDSLKIERLDSMQMGRQNWKWLVEYVVGEGTHLNNRQQKIVDEFYSDTTLARSDLMYSIYGPAKETK
tara:strand:- start:590 stop:856 length:267 start_codon:yes stop_codon:yes gene_type:complete